MRNMPDRLVLATWARQARAESGLSQAGLGREVGVARQFIEHLEGGRSGQLETVVRIAKLTGYDPWTVIAAAELMPPDVLTYLVECAPEYRAEEAAT